MPDVLLNPDALHILSCAELGKAIPDFEWSKGHSGLVLSEEQAKKLEEVWADFLTKNNILFTEAKNKRYQEDLVYMSDKLITS